LQLMQRTRTETGALIDSTIDYTSDSRDWDRNSHRDYRRTLTPRSHERSHARPAVTHYHGYLASIDNSYRKLRCARSSAPSHRGCLVPFRLASRVPTGGAGARAMRCVSPASPFVFINAVFCVSYVILSLILSSCSRGVSATSSCPREHLLYERSLGPLLCPKLRREILSCLFDAPRVFSCGALP